MDDEAVFIIESDLEYFVVALFAGMQSTLDVLAGEPGALRRHLEMMESLCNEPLTD